MLLAMMATTVVKPPQLPSPRAPPMPPRLPSRRFPPPPVPTAPSPPTRPVVWCVNNPEYFEEGWACADWAGEQCASAIESYGMSASFDVNRLLLSCPKACSDGQPICLPPPPSPSPPAPPSLPPSPPPIPAPVAPPYPHARCVDDLSYSDAGWKCADWTGRECRSGAAGVDVELLLFSCPNACADVVAVCFPPEPPIPAPPTRPPPPSPPPELQWCVGYAFRHQSIDSVIVALQHAQASLPRSSPCAVTHRSRSPLARARSHGYPWAREFGTWMPVYAGKERLQWRSPLLSGIWSGLVLIELRFPN